MELDLNELFERGTLALNHPRGDEGRPHLGGDVAGICDRQGWERRYRATHGLPPLEHDSATLKLFARGHAMEAMVLDRIEAGLPQGFILTRDEVVAYRGCVGHLDAAIYYHPEPDFEPDKAGIPVMVLDVKSTVWWQSRDEYNRIVWVPKEVRDSHQIQIAAYAIAIGAPLASLFEYDVASDQVRETHVDVDSYRALVERRITEVLNLTDPAKPAPAAAPLPGAEWACGKVKRAKNKLTGEYDQIIARAYCNVTSCPSHVANAPVEV